LERQDTREMPRVNRDEKNSGKSISDLLRQFDWDGHSKMSHNTRLNSQQVYSESQAFGALLLCQVSEV